MVLVLLVQDPGCNVKKNNLYKGYIKMEAQTLKELHQQAKTLGLTGHWNLNKPELILLIRKSKGKGPVPRPRKPPGYTIGTYKPVAPKRIGSKKEVLPSYEDIKDDRPPNYYLRYEAIIKYWQTIFPNRADLDEIIYLTSQSKKATLRINESQLNSLSSSRDVSTVLLLLLPFIKAKFPLEDARFLLVMTFTLYQREMTYPGKSLTKARLFREMPYGDIPRIWKRRSVTFKRKTTLIQFQKILDSNIKRYKLEDLYRIEYLLEKKGGHTGQGLLSGW